ncbi:hypothetical protein [Bacteroides intestinalis]|jgi:hypothetical protein|uniref:hypothetical protein n=1 Tax=Bacteroides intestinalis TaxID=329854 RepID=UPI000E5537D7|nr:hypothetical protein [Bacteroides intestinalis]RGX87302.1 hypothetical protein DXA61_03185 [Bacteroides intestinalis]
MKVLILLFAILLYPFQDTSTQNRILRKYRSYYSRSFGIELNKLDDFKVINKTPLSIGGMPIFRAREKHSIGSIYQIALESKAKDSLILYTHFNTLPSHKLVIKHRAYGKVAATLNLYEDRILRADLLANNKFVLSNKPDYEYAMGMTK